MLLMRRFTVSTGYPDPTGGALAISGRFDVIVLDLTGAFESGLSLCRRLRTAGITSPILTVFPEGGQAELLAAFEAGTDAYMCGPIEDAELLGRIGTLYRLPEVTAHRSGATSTAKAQ